MSVKNYFFIALIFIYGNAKTIGTGPEHTKNVFCSYYIFEGGPEGEIQNPNLCTHVIAQSAKIDTNSVLTLREQDKRSDALVNRRIRILKELTSMKIRYPHLKIILNLTTFSYKISGYSFVSNSVENRKKLIESVVNFLKDHDLDGIDINLSYDDGNNVKSSLLHLIKDFKNELQKHNYLLSLTTPATETPLNGYDMSIASDMADFIVLIDNNYYYYTRNYMTYSAITRPLNLNNIINSGIPSHKIILPISFMMPEYTLSKNNDPNSAKQYKTWQYNYERCRMFLADHWTMSWDDNVKLPFAYKNTRYIFYENQRSIVEKVRNGIKHDIGGFSTWEQQYEKTGYSCPKEDGLFSDLLAKLEALNENKKNRPLLKHYGFVNCTNMFEDCFVEVPQLHGFALPLSTAINKALTIFENEKSLMAQLETGNLEVPIKGQDDNNNNKFIIPSSGITAGSQPPGGDNESRKHTENKIDYLSANDILKHINTNYNFTSLIFRNYSIVELLWKP